MLPISLLRFNALAGYARDPRSAVYAEELGWFEHDQERVLGLLIRDRADNDFAGVVFARDELLQYRWTTMTDFASTPRRARALLRPSMERAAMAPVEEHYQGHPRRKPVDFFTPLVEREGLNPGFLSLIELEGFSPARGIIEPMMRWYEDVDGNFVEQFQTAAFDARLWELYLFATLVEMGFRLDRTNVAPDFIASGLRGSIAIEAVTVNPTRDRRRGIILPPPTTTVEERFAYLREYMPIKFGSALYSKLAREYWAQPHVRGLPFTLAIQDFSAPGSMISTRSALQVYLYGYDHNWRHDADGHLIVTPRRITTHRWETKEIPSGFFFLPGSENVSAVIFSNSGTISKFNRMGLLTGFGSQNVQMIREGFVYDDGDPDSAAPKQFRHVVNSPSYKETWVEGLTVYHNPRALLPLDSQIFPGAAHISLLPDGNIGAFTPSWYPLGSRTIIVTPKPVNAPT
jgi:hypothetical protein